MAPSPFAGIGGGFPGPAQGLARMLAGAPSRAPLGPRPLPRELLRAMQQQQIGRAAGQIGQRGMNPNPLFQQGAASFLPRGFARLSPFNPLRRGGI